MLKTMDTKSGKLKKNRVEVGSDGKNKHYGKAKLDNRDKIGSNKVNDNEIGNDKIPKEKNYLKT